MILDRVRVRYCGVVERLKERFYHPVQLVRPYLLVSGIIFELHPWFLPPRACFERGLFQ